MSCAWTSPICLPLSLLQCFSPCVSFVVLQVLQFPCHLCKHSTLLLCPTRLFVLSLLSYLLVQWTHHKHQWLGLNLFPPRIMNAPPASKRKDRQGIVVARLLQWVHFIMGTFKTYAHGCTAMQSVAQHIMMLQHLNQSSQSYLANVGRETQLLIIAEQGVTTCHGFRVAGRSATVCFQLPELWFHTFLQRQLLLATMRWWQGDTFLDRAPQSKKRRVHMCCMWMGVQWWQE